jgi:hypothetical protein
MVMNQNRGGVQEPVLSQTPEAVRQVDHLIRRKLGGLLQEADG